MYYRPMQAGQTYTHSQLAFAALVVLVFAFLTYFGKVSGDATIALVSGVTGAVLAAPLAAKSAQSEARAEGFKEGVSHPTDNGNGHSA